jgi:hypothetical protein
MKRALVVVLAAAAAVALYAAAAPAGQQVVTPKQFTALKNRVVKLEKDDKDLIDFANVVAACVFDKGAVPTTKTPQYHVTGTGETADFYTLTTNNEQCVQFINSPLAKRVLKLSRGG